MELSPGVGGGASGDGTSVIVDGVSASIRATVFDLANSNPQAMALVDANGDQITSFGGGTQYTDGAAAPANPVGTIPVFNDGGTIRAVSAANPLPVTATFSPSGTQDVNLTKVGGTAFALGQQLAAASLPVVLTAAQITTLTPQTDALTDTQLRATPVPVSLTSTTITNSVSVTQGTSPWVVSNGGTFAVQATLAAETTKVIGTVNQGTSPWVVSGTVTTGGLTDAELRATPVPVSLTSTTITGTVAVTQSGAWTVTANAGTDLNTSALLTTTAFNAVFGTAGTADTQVLTVQGITGMTPLLVDGSGSTQPISGTVTVTQGTAANLNATVVGTGTFATQATLQAGTAYAGKVRLTDGTTDSTLLDLTNSNPLTVAIVDSNGDQIASFGGGTQYAEDSALGATPTGTLTMLRRDDTLSTLTPIEDDAVSGRTNARGAMWVAQDLTVVPTVQGDVAHGDANSGNPLQMGAVAIAYGTNPTAVDAGDRTKLYANRAGVLTVIGGHPNIVTLEYDASATAKTNDPIVTVAGGLKIVVTQIQVINDALSPNVVDFRIGFATATTPTTTGVVAMHPGMIPGAFYTRGDGGGILGVGADGEDLRITSADPGTGGEIRVLVSYYTIDS